MKKKTKKKIGAKKVWRLIRHLEKGDRLLVRGVRGKRIKTVRAGRNYILEVRRGGKLKGYINNVDPKGNPIPKPYTISMLNRLKHTTIEKLTGQNREQSYSFKVTDQAEMSRQIPDHVVQEILSRRRCTYGFRLEFERYRLVTPFLYTDGNLKEKDLRKTILSCILQTLGMNNVRISPILEGTSDHRRINRIREAQITLEFMQIGGLGNEKIRGPEAAEPPAKRTAKVKARKPVTSRKRPTAKPKKSVPKTSLKKKRTAKKPASKKPTQKTKRRAAPGRRVRGARGRR